MSERKISSTTLTVTYSETLIRPDGRAAIMLETRERGPIAFEVDLEAIAALRRHLTVAEQHIRQSRQNQTRN
ncbi:MULTISPECIES: hypothetical protein [Bradyrhizobium]|jgi:hypothetical protein|uniref:hypothetical protein n=1 Tax=Bradyrhizobium TaxID=374 RepID=UPI00056EF740|nr:hypothetical protein [Bradyrhizobium elkanii]MCS3524560.1 hypothetical protein [Bradyrhizobium elkanii]MCS4072215.1 hypothetical protein [Bradyrhizobium elkanii]MCS4078849.1 hypothetical protein [Bradyrhizobium elkanii]MCW2122553.1 hypothetical protein [Bradyrhizobium elkanii]MCW2169300.1 hypothetical protein [Bradyrhizobium elkanii]